MISRSKFRRMKKKVLLAAFAMAVCSATYAQVVFKTEYFGKSGYRMAEGDTNEKVGNSQGSAVVYEGGVHIPLYKKLNENNRPTMWAVSAGASYAKLNNRNFTEPLVVDEILDLGLGLTYLRPVNEKWSMMATVGGGIYMPGTRFSDMKFKNILGSAGVVFIRHLKPNLELGGGLAINNSFGYPMVFPAFHLNWKTENKYAVRISVMKGLEVSVAYSALKNLRLSLVAEMNGQMALLEQGGKGKIFSHQYLIAGFRPEIKISKKVSIPITVGISATRPAKMVDRKLASMFQDRDYYFQAAPHASVGLQIGL